MIAKYINKLYSLFLSAPRKILFERIIFLAAIILFILHSLAIIFINWGIIPVHFYTTNGSPPNLLAAIYTPFSLILLYEIYLLIYYLTESITTYLAKQYEIIAIILIRRTFDELANLSSMERVYDIDHISGLLWTFGGLLLLFLLIFCFYQLSGYKHVRIDESACSNKQKSFILIKKVLSLILFVVFVFVFMASFVELYHFSSLSLNNFVSLLKQMSNTFFGTFFTALILTEVLLLLFTYSLTESFSKVIRNSGFIISTIMLKLSFNTDGEINMLFILIAVSFGVMVLGISRLFDRRANKLIDN